MSRYCALWIGIFMEQELFFKESRCGCVLATLGADLEAALKVAERFCRK